MIGLFFIGVAIGLMIVGISVFLTVSMYKKDNKKKKGKK